MSVKKVNEDDICRSNRILLYKKQDKVRGDVPQNMFLSVNLKNRYGPKFC